MANESCGTLLYRYGSEGLEVLIVHPSGSSNADQPWSIPKGKPEIGESHEEAARRETREETGVEPPTELIFLGTVKYKNKKTIYGFAGEVSKDIIPTCASWEVDQAQFISFQKAEEKLHPAQSEFISRLRRALLNKAFPDYK